MFPVSVRFCCLAGLLPPVLSQEIGWRNVSKIDYYVMSTGTQNLTFSVPLWSCNIRTVTVYVLQSSEDSHLIQRCFPWLSSYCAWAVSVIFGHDNRSSLSSSSSWSIHRKKNEINGFIEHSLASEIVVCCWLTVYCYSVYFTMFIIYFIRSDHSTNLTRSIWKMLGPFATASRRTPLVLILHCHSPGVATVARSLRIDVHNNDDNDNNDNTWQRGPLWPHRMGPINSSTTLISIPESHKKYL